MPKIIKADRNIIVMFEDGSYMENNDVSEELYNQIINADNDEEIFALMNPEYKEAVKEYNEAINLKDKVNNSNILTLKVDSIYWEDVSPLSLPTDLAERILDAESDNNELLLETYKNFWTLMSLNPDEECRKNLFWFLNRNGLQLSKHGFFVAYRNVDTTDKPEVFTDHHSHTFKIKIGEMVTLDRSKCDCDSNRECSRGLICSPVY